MTALRKLIGKAGLLPGCHMKDMKGMDHMVGKVHAGPLALGMAGVIAAGKVHADPSVLVQVGFGAYPMNFWPCDLKLQRWPGSS